MDDFLLMKKSQSRSQLRDVKPNSLFWKRPHTLEVNCKDGAIGIVGAFDITCTRTAQVPSQHQVQNEEAVLVILESVAKVDEERMVDLPTSVSGGHQGQGSMKDALLRASAAPV